MPVRARGRIQRNVSGSDAVRLAALCCQPFFCPISPLIPHEPAKCGMLTPKFAAA